MLRDGEKSRTKCSEVETKKKKKVPRGEAKILDKYQGVELKSGGGGRS